jgi:phosphoribosylformylglycinamidine synthase
LRFVSNSGAIAKRYSKNPDSPFGGIGGPCSLDSRFNLMMPHPERYFRAVQHSWYAAGWDKNAPSLRLFFNTRLWMSGK